VSKTGRKTFRYRYPITKKEQTLLTIVNYPAINLSDARERRDDARELIKHGIDPSEQKQRQKPMKENNSNLNNVYDEAHELGDDFFK